MQKPITRIIVMVLVVGCSHFGFAQSGEQSPPAKPLVSRAAAKPAGSLLTLDEAIRTGLATHPLLERSRYSALIAKALTRQTQGERYPWLEASIAGSSGSLRIITTDGKTIHDRGGHGFDPGGALAKHNQNMVSGGFILNQLISDFGYTAHRILASEANEAASEKEILTNKAFVILNVQKAYLSSLLQQSLVTIATETVKQRQAVRDQVEALYQHQLKSRVDLDLMLVEVSTAELSLIKAQNDLKQSFAVLNNAMGIKGPPAFAKLAEQCQQRFCYSCPYVHMHQVAHFLFRILQFIGIALHKLVSKRMVDLQHGFKKAQINITDRDRLNSRGAYRIFFFVAQSPVAKHVSRFGKTKDQLLLIAPLPVHFYDTAVYEVHAAYRLAFLKEGSSFFKPDIFTVSAYQRLPAGQAVAAEEAKAEITTILRCRHLEV